MISLGPQHSLYNYKKGKGGVLHYILITDETYSGQIQKVLNLGNQPHNFAQNSEQYRAPNKHNRLSKHLLNLNFDINSDFSNQTLLENSIQTFLNTLKE